MYYGVPLGIPIPASHYTCPGKAGGLSSDKILGRRIAVQGAKELHEAARKHDKKEVHFLLKRKPWSKFENDR